MALRGTLTHRKTRRLARALSIDPPFAMGILEALWHVASENQHDGGIGRMSNQDIAEEMHYSGDPEALVKGLTDSGWLEKSGSCRLYVHDWHDHADDHTKASLIQRGLLFANGKAPSLRRFNEAQRMKIVDRYERMYGPDVARQMRDSRDNSDSCAISRDVARETPIEPDFARHQKPVPEASARSQCQKPEGSTANLQVCAPLQISKPQSAERDHEADFARLYANHPQAKRKGRGLALNSYAQSVQGGVDPELITSVHAAMCRTETWRWKSGAQAPTLAEWLVDHGWEHPPSDMRIMQVVEKTDTRTDAERWEVVRLSAIKAGATEQEAKELADQQQGIDIAERNKELAHHSRDHGGVGLPATFPGPSEPSRESG